ncbi:MAG TPA: hypothetical protein VGA04_34505 [Streptosporangiaceae bacterium]
MGGVLVEFIFGAGCRHHVTEPPDRPAAGSWDGGVRALVVGAPRSAAMLQPEQDQPSGECNQPETCEAV